ncbi:MAG: uppS [Phenylobacterium sp.]|nr:uppS [Phenylobacterium sp.]
MAAPENTPSAGAPEQGAGEGPQLHVAIVMDGNGRWAKRRGLPRSVGHQAGAETLKRIVQAAQDLGIRWLTIFGFSTETWSRPVAEVAELLALPQRYFRSDLPRLVREGVRVRVIGRQEGLSHDLLKICREAEARTARNSTLFLTIAFNYGGQADITDAARRFAEDVAAGRAAPGDLTEAGFAQYLSTSELPPPDLIVRPSGEQRLSNFVLWEAAYAEFVFQDVLWPDYSPEHLKAAIAEYYTRDRRYGAVVADDVLAAG